MPIHSLWIVKFPVPCIILITSLIRLCREHILRCFYLSSWENQCSVVQKVPDFSVSYPTTRPMRDCCVWHGRHQDHINWPPRAGPNGFVPFIAISSLCSNLSFIELPIIKDGNRFPTIYQHFDMRDIWLAACGYLLFDVFTSIRGIEQILKLGQQKTYRRR